MPRKCDFAWIVGYLALGSKQNKPIGEAGPLIHFSFYGESVGGLELAVHKRAGREAGHRGSESTE